MRKRWVVALYRLSVVVTTGVVLGEGCIGPDDLRSGFLESFNAMVFRAIELGLANLFQVPTEV